MRTVRSRDPRWQVRSGSGARCSPERHWSGARDSAPGACERTGHGCLRWQLGWSVVCVRHRELLHDRCPRCSSSHTDPPASDMATRRSGTPERSDPLPEHPPAELVRRVAASGLGDPRQRGARARPSEDRRTARGWAQPTLAGENLDPPVYLHDLRALANILYARPRLEGAPGPRRRSCAPVLDDPTRARGRPAASARPRRPSRSRHAR